MKKMIVCSLLAMMCALSLTACGAPAANTSTTAAAPTAVTATQETAKQVTAKQNTTASVINTTTENNLSSNTLKAQPVQRPEQTQAQKAIRIPVQNQVQNQQTQQQVQPQTQQQNQSQQAQQQKPQNVISIEATGYTRFTTVDDLQVRQQPSTSAATFGSLKKNTQLTVTGNVLVNGQYTNWVRVNFNGYDAYVCSDFLSANPVVTAPTRTGESMLLYFDNGCSVTVHKYTDDTWRDDDNLVYINRGNDVWTAADNSCTVYAYNPTEIAHAGSEINNDGPIADTPEATAHAGSETDNNGPIAADNEHYTVNVERGYLALRSVPCTDAANEIGQLQNGDDFFVTEKMSNGFWYGHTANGAEGYVNSQFLI